MKLFVILTLTLSSGLGFAAGAGDCLNPQPIFGKVLATCGDQMITYVGDEKTKVLGQDVVISRFELAYCENGGGRKSLNLETNSEGWKLSYQNPYETENYTVANMWLSFEMSGIGYNGEKIQVTCQPYNDTRANIEHIFAK